MSWGIEWKEFFFFLFLVPNKNGTAEPLAMSPASILKKPRLKKLAALPPAAGRCRHSRKLSVWTPLGAPHHIPLHRRA